MVQAGAWLLLLIVGILAACWIAGTFHLQLQRPREAGNADEDGQRVQQRTLVFSLPLVAWWAAYSVEREAVLGHRSALLVHAFTMAVVYLVIAFLAGTGGRSSVASTEGSAFARFLHARLWRPILNGALGVYWIVVLLGWVQLSFALSQP